MTGIRQHPNADEKYKVQESIEQAASGSSPNANVLTQRPFPL